MSDDRDDLHAPVTRAELERALRNANLNHLDTRDALLQLAAHVVALTDELVRRLDGVEPTPAIAGPYEAVPGETIEEALDRVIPDALTNIRLKDTSANRVELDASGVDKYATASPDIPCDELIPLCRARCCRLSFPLSSDDLDEGVIRWDYGQPYRIRQRASDGYCVHNDTTTHGCTAHAHRPRVCRTYDCRDDARIWKDFANRIPADPTELVVPTLPPSSEVDLVERLRARRLAIVVSASGSGMIEVERDAIDRASIKP